MPDLPQNNTTPIRIGIGESYLGELETSGDRDWVRLNTTNGEMITVNLQGTGFDPVTDTYLRIYDGAGRLVAQNDDAYPGTLTSSVTFTPDGNGPYFAEAAAWNDGRSGSYQLDVAAPPTPMDSLDWGTQLPSNVITVYFVPSGQSRTMDGEVFTSEGFNAYERAQFNAVFDQIEAVADVQFVISNDPNADFQVVLDTDQIQGEYLGVFNPPEVDNPGVGIFDGTSWDRQADGNLQNGGFGYVTITHELLHGMGLAHPHDNGGSSFVFAGVNSAFGDYGTGNLNQGIFTTMSYNSGYFTGTDGSAPDGDLGNPDVGNYGYENGPMALDIATLQAIYGANTNHNNGDNTYTLATANEAGTMWTAIWDTGGTDRIVAGAGNQDAFIDLRAATLEFEYGGGGRVSATRGIAGGYTIAHDVIIENADGAGGDDTLRGNAAANRLNGKSGNDTIFGREGNDVVIGGGGVDVLNGGSGADRLFGGADNDRLDGGIGNDFLDGQRGNDSVHGRDGADTLSGNDGNDRVWGGYGQDQLNGGNGNDQLKGGRDNDVAYGGSGTDRIFGEHGRDKLHGGSDNDIIYGNGNDDRIWGDTGNDRLFGGDGRDTLKGGRGNDTIEGGSGNDKLFGEIGSDILKGGSGADIINGGSGSDVLTGGTGADVFDFNARSDSARGASRADVITDFETGTDKIDLRDVEGDITQGGTQDFVAIGGAGFSGIPGEVRWVTSNGNTTVYVNNNADRTADMEIFLEGVTGLSTSDFLL